MSSVAGRTRAQGKSQLPTTPPKKTPNSPPSSPTTSEASMIDLNRPRQVSLQDSLMAIKDQFAEMTAELKKSYKETTDALHHQNKQLKEELTESRKREEDLKLELQKLREENARLSAQVPSRQMDSTNSSDRRRQQQPRRPSHQENLTQPSPTNNPIDLSLHSSEDAQDLEDGQIVERPRQAPATYLEAAKAAANNEHNEWTTQTSKKKQARHNATPPLSAKESWEQSRQAFAAKLKSAAGNPAQLMSIISKTPSQRSKDVKETKTIVCVRPEDHKWHQEALEHPFMTWHSVVESITGHRATFISLKSTKIAEVTFDEDYAEAFKKLQDSAYWSQLPIHRNPAEDMGRCAQDYLKCRYPSLRQCVLRGWSHEHQLQLIDRVEKSLSRWPGNKENTLALATWKHVIKQDRQTIKDQMAAALAQQQMDN